MSLTSRIADLLFKEPLTVNYIAASIGIHPDEVLGVLLEHPTLFRVNPGDPNAWYIMPGISVPVDDHILTIGSFEEYECITEPLPPLEETIESKRSLKSGRPKVKLLSCEEFEAIWNEPVS